MGAQNAKEGAKHDNISEETVARMNALFKSHGATKGKMDKTQFESAFPILQPISSEFFDRITSQDADHKLHVKTLLQCADAAFGTHSDHAEVIKNIMGHDVASIIENITKVFCTENGAKISEEYKLKEYLMSFKPTIEKFDKLFLECPLFEKMSLFIFSSILSTQPPPGIRPTLSGESQLLNFADYIVLNSHLAMDQQKKWNLLFSSGTMGASFSQMSKKINHEGPCLVIIRSNNMKVFGFYASEGICSGPRYHGGHRCFLFELQPNIRTYSSTGRENSYVYLNFQQQSLPNGLGIGGHDDVWPIFIHEEFGTGICQKDSSVFEKCFVAGEKEFIIRDLEVWRVGEKPVQRDEEGEIIVVKKGKSILDKDPEAQAVLEMAGKTRHSEAYREPAPLLDEE